MLQSDPELGRSWARGFSGEAGWPMRPAPSMLQSFRKTEAGFSASDPQPSMNSGAALVPHTSGD